jgi:hypothetical protein
MPGIRPLLKLSYAANHAIGLGAAGFHAVNVAIHAGSALLVRSLLVRLAAREGQGAREAGVVGLAGALVFALHPVQTEAVTYVSGRSSSLAALFALGSVVAWVAGRGSKSWLVHGVSPALFALALGVKEVAAVVPLVLLLIAVTDPRRRPRLLEALVSVAGHVAVVLAAVGAVLASPTYRRLLATSLEARSLADNLRTQADAVVYLAGQLVRFDRLNVDPTLPVHTEWTGVLVLQAVVVVALVGGALAVIRRWPSLALGVLWFFVWLAPTNSLLPRLDPGNDRQLYVALVGPVWLLARLVPRLAPRIALAVVLAVTCVLGLATVSRNRAYASEIALWEDTLRKSPHNARAHNNLGYAYALACRKDDAVAEWRAALALDAGNFHAAINLKLLRENSLPGTEPCPPDD